MYQALQIVTLLLVATAWALAFAHAAELPGKMRLDRDAYLRVQPIYYPGFTIAASSEPLAIIALAALIAFTPADAPAFPLILMAFAAAVANHAVYWLVTHKVNNFWLQSQRLSGAGERFFSTAASKVDRESDWTRLRDRWEYSHVARAVLMSLALVGLAVSLTLPD